jgi:hypothetical protein
MLSRPSILLDPERRQYDDSVKWWELLTLQHTKSHPRRLESSDIAL